MGNQISYSSDDEFLRISMNFDQNLELKKQLHSDLLKCDFLKISFFEISDFGLLLLKMKVNDLEKVN